MTPSRRDWRKRHRAELGPISPRVCVGLWGSVWESAGMISVHILYPKTDDSTFDMGGKIMADVANYTNVAPELIIGDVAR